MDQAAGGSTFLGPVGAPRGRDSFYAPDPLCLVRPTGYPRVIDSLPVKDNSDALADEFGASILDPAYCGKTTKRRLMTNKDRYDVSDSVELVLVHPFREGNGRCARLLASIMALQAGLPVLDFSLLSKMKKADYFAAVQAGMDRNYRPMEDLFAEIIENSIRA
ncbi:MAG: hypothetical protein U5J94_11495 [Thiohalophilus sp.]|nr:hypothetical protein [Thiohalophilus sp.]